jgi:hypothetical protein
MGIDLLHRKNKFLFSLIRQKGLGAYSLHTKGYLSDGKLGHKANHSPTFSLHLRMVSTIFPPHVFMIYYSRTAKILKFYHHISGLQFHVQLMELELRKLFATYKVSTHLFLCVNRKKSENVFVL